MDEKQRLADTIARLLLPNSGASNGERAAAKRKLEQLAQKYGVTPGTNPEQESMYWFSCQGDNERMVLTHLAVIYAPSIRIQEGYRYFVHTKKRNKIGLILTASAYAEIAPAWEIIRPAYKQHLKEATLAFIVANNLFIKEAPKAGEQTKEQSESTKRIALLAMATNAVDLSTKKRLASGKE